MTPRIDFLPPSYVQNRQRRQKAVYRRAVVAAFVALVALGAVRQWQVQRQMEATRDRLRTHARDMLAQLGSPDELKERIVRLDVRANLVAQLRLHHSPSRILHAVARALPPTVTLTELRYESESPPPPAATPPGGGESLTDKGTASPEDADLARLRGEASSAAVTVLLTGLAPDDVTLSRSLMSLRRSGFFEETRLQYSEEVSLRDMPFRKFVVRLRLRRPAAGPAPSGAIADAGVREALR